MLWLRDSRTGSPIELRPTIPGLVRIRAVIPTTTGLALKAIRVALVADALARAAELRGAQALTAYAEPGDHHDREDFHSAAADFGIHPPTAAALDTADVTVVSADHPAPDAAGGALISVGPVTVDPVTVGPFTDHARPLGESELDPLAIRLALLAVTYDQPAELDQATTRAAMAELSSWRRLVAGWAESPSGPIPPPIQSALLTAFGRLDIVSAIAAIRGLASAPGAGPGARFETFVYADRVLGLDLAREIGKA